MSFRSKKIASALLATTTLFGAKVTCPTAAMDSELKKTVQNKKGGMPTWAKWLIGGASATGVAAVAVGIWWKLYKNKNSQALDKANKQQQNIDNKIKIEDKNDYDKIKLNAKPVQTEKNREQQNIDKKEDKNDDEQELNIDFIEEKNEPKEKIGQINAEEKKKKKQSHWVGSYLYQNIVVPDTNIQEIKNIMVINEKEFYETVEAYPPLKEIMERFKNNQFCKKNFVGLRDLSSMKKLNKTFKTFTYDDVLGKLKKEISINGKPISIKLVEDEKKPVINGFKNLILNEFHDSKVVQYRVEFPANVIFNVFLFGDKRVAFNHVSSGILFECEEPII